MAGGGERDPLKGVKGAGFIAAPEIMPGGPHSKSRGALIPALDAPSCFLSVVCHAGLVVPSPPIPELPSLLLFLPSPPPHSCAIHRHRLPFTRTLAHRDTCFPSLLLAVPIPRLCLLNLEAGFDMLPAFLFPISPSWLSCF